MYTQSTPFSIEIPNFGRVPLQLNHGDEATAPVDVTHCSPKGGPDPFARFLSPDIIRFVDPTTKLVQYAVRKQKVVTLTVAQLDQLMAGKLTLGTVTGEGQQGRVQETLRSINENPEDRIIRSDCPDVNESGELTYTVLLNWTEETSVPLPDLLLHDPVKNETANPLTQANNFLVISRSDGGGDPNNPPPRPPVTASGPLNSQTSDFRTASANDLAHYKRVRAVDSRNQKAAVAVMDTGLKFNLHNLNEEGQWPTPYLYRDADGQERPFTLAYQDQADAGCSDMLTENHLGYCSLRAYRQPAFISAIKPLPTNTPPVEITPADVANSPYDDFRLYTDAQETTLRDARHGTSITAIIQQTGDDAPVLAVKSFDNMGFATLFDVLNGLNYILHRAKTANIRVVNASWIFMRDEPLLKQKIRQLGKAGVLVVAAAGNDGQTASRNLDAMPVYPACYSQEFPHVITVTSVRKMYRPGNTSSRRTDSVIGGLLTDGIRKLNLFGLLNNNDNLLGNLLPASGYVAVENYSTTFVNVGVVSTFGYFRSPFWTGNPIRGSSFASAFVSGFIIRQLNTRPDLLPTHTPVSAADMAALRQKLLDAMNIQTDENLKNNYVVGGRFLKGYNVD